MNIEQEIAADMAEEIAKEIDFGILATLLVENGWTTVEVDHYTSNENAIDIADWAETNCKGKHIKHGRKYVFELKADAEWFTIKWI